MDMPILIMAYNRDRHFARCLSAVKILGALNIYVSQDGPKATNDLGWLRTREIIAENVKNGTIVKHQILAENHGILTGVQKSISWFFRQVDSGLILEDDLILHNSALLDAERLLGLMNEDKSIGAVCLYPALAQNVRVKINSESFRYSVFSNSFGWGTSAEKWNNQVTEITFSVIYASFKYLIKHVGIQIAIGWVLSLVQESFHQRKFRKGDLTKGIWDIRWTNSLFANNWFALVMNNNNVENIGWDESATNTKLASKLDLEQLALDMPNDIWIEPFQRYPNAMCDRLTMNKFSLYMKVRSFVALRTRLRRLFGS